MNKKELEKKKQSKKQDKLKKKEDGKTNGAVRTFEDMIAYVDENGMIVDTPPDLTKKTKIEAETISISTPKKEDVEFTPLVGRVDHYNNDKGYGFIKDTTTNDKYFFHINNAFSSIAEGNMVNYELERGQKGMNAVKVTIINNN